MDTVNLNVIQKYWHHIGETESEHEQTTSGKSFNYREGCLIFQWETLLSHHVGNSWERPALKDGFKKGDWRFGGLSLLHVRALLPMVRAGWLGILFNIYHLAFVFSSQAVAKVLIYHRTFVSAAITIGLINCNNYNCRHRRLTPPALPRRTSADSWRCCFCFQGFLSSTDGHCKISSGWLRASRDAPIAQILPCLSWNHHPPCFDLSSWQGGLV